MTRPRACRSGGVPDRQRADPPAGRESGFTGVAGRGRHRGVLRAITARSRRWSSMDDLRSPRGRGCPREHLPGSGPARGVAVGSPSRRRPREGERFQRAERSGEHHHHMVCVAAGGHAVRGRQPGARDPMSLRWGKLRSEGARDRPARALSSLLVGPGGRRCRPRPRPLEALAARTVRDPSGPIADLGAEGVEEPAHLPPGMGLQALAVAGGRRGSPRRLAQLISSPTPRGAPWRSARPRPPWFPWASFFSSLGNVDHRTGVVAVQKLVPKEMPARPAGVAVGTEDLGVADRNHGALSDRHESTPMLILPLKRTRRLEGVDVALVIVLPCAVPPLEAAARPVTRVAAVAATDKAASTSLTRVRVNPSPSSACGVSCRSRAERAALRTSASNSPGTAFDAAPFGSPAPPRHGPGGFGRSMGAAQYSRATARFLGVVDRPGLASFLERSRPGPARRPVDRAIRQLLQPGAVRRTHNAPLGTGDRSRPQTGGIRGYMSPATRAFAVFEELLRVDPAHHLFGLRLNVAAVLCLIGLAWFARSQRAPGRVKKVNGPALLAAGAIALLSGCGHTAQRDETHLRGSPISQLRIPEPAVMSPGGQAPISKPPGVVEFPHVPV